MNSGRFNDYPKGVHCKRLVVEVIGIHQDEDIVCALLKDREVLGTQPV